MMSTMSPLQKKFHRLIRATGVFDDDFYRSQNADVARSGIDLLEHYIVAGENEGRMPNPFFDPAWYLKQRPRVGKGLSLLAHYLTVGDEDGYQPVVGFDPAYVRAQVPERKEPALVSFLQKRRDGSFLNPNRFFDYGWYLENNPDVAAAGVDAYFHFVHVGVNEGRTPSPDFSWYYLRERFNLSGSNSDVFRQVMLRWRMLDLGETDGEPSVAMLQDQVRSNHRPSPLYEPHAPPSPASTRRSTDVYAFYLTQYHQIPENDEWWGQGFTEWHNVVRGVPRFGGHYQPRIPSALGFYDLADHRVMPRQVELAKQAGLAGFAFYYYNFGNKRLLERPLEQFRSDPSLDMSYFLIWANETWSRRWDGSESDVLIEQTYPEGLLDDLADDLVLHFQDARYRRIEGRPLFVIYRAGALPAPRDWVDALRAAFARRGYDPLIYMAQTFGDLDPSEYGLDGALEFPPHKYSSLLAPAVPERIFVGNPGLRVWNYDDFVDVAKADAKSPFPIIRTCFPSWDNDSRRQGSSSIVHGSTPAKFAIWLQMLLERAEAAPDQPNIVCINAWNEWGEGAYLEPDRHFGYAYLNAVQRALHPVSDSRYSRILLVGHDAFPAGAQRLLLNLGRTLTRQYGKEVAFLLLRTGAGYDHLLGDYRAVAETIIIDDNLEEVIKQLSARGFMHAIVNSSASAEAVEQLSAAEIDQILLVHELPGMIRDLGAEPLIRDAADKVRCFIVPTSAISFMLVDHGVTPSRIRLLPQGQYRSLQLVDRQEARASLLRGQQERRLVVGLGFADTRKGADLFVETAEAAARSGEDVTFIWQGGWDNAVYAALEPRIKDLEAQGYLRLRPNSDAIEELLGAADVFLLPSREDPLPSVAMEAWSIGLPVAAISGAGGVPDLIAAEPRLGALAEAPEGSALLQAVFAAGRHEGDQQFRRDWTAERFNWPRYVRHLLLEVQSAPDVDAAIIGFNHGRYAKARIDSLLRQTLTPSNIGYHDMASTDGSGNTAKGMSLQAGVKYSAEPANKGRLHRTWQELAGRSEALYFHIAEGDDTIEPTMLERCVEALERCPDAAYAFVGVSWTDDADRSLVDHTGYPASVIGPAAVEGGEISARQLLSSDFLVKNPILSISSVVWRRETLLQLLGDNEAQMDKLRFAFDWLLYLRAARAGHSAVFVPQLLCRHRQHESSFAARDDIDRHREEIQSIYQIEPTPKFAKRRAEYLESLG